MKKVFVNSLNIVSPLGNTAAENYSNVAGGKAGVKEHFRSIINDYPFNASLLKEEQIELLGFADDFSRYENLIVASITDALKNSNIEASDKNTIFIYSTTKGNISLLESETNDEKAASTVSLAESADKITTHFRNTNTPVVISNACISGVVALLYARRVLETGEYQNAIVSGADCINKFIFSGFSSFQALSDGACKPFSASRDGINLGEAAATIVLSVNPAQTNKPSVQVLNGAITNDANHISGPSRTGEELFAAIDKAISLSGINKNEIDFISAHGTATTFNDEMEAKAITLAGLNDIPVNSLKGYFGHTLGAAGLVESAIGIMALEADEIIPTMGFTSPVVQPEINVTNNIIKKPGMKYFLKTASGFGGCNAALIFSKS